MSMKRCIPEMLGDGRINAKQAERLGSLYNELEQDYSTKFGKQAAEAMASEEAVKRFQAEALHTKRQAALQIKAQQGIAADLRQFRGDSPSAAAIALFTGDARAPYANVERIADQIEGQAHSMMSGLLEKFSRNIVGQVRDRATLRNVVREAFGEGTGDAAAKELADAWGQTAEMLRTRFNAAGGGIGKIDNWGMPQVHNWLAVRNVSFGEWRDFIGPMLDRQKMKDISGSPMTAQQLELALRNVYETITSEGWNTRKAGQMGSSKMANRHGDPRFLIFKDPDSWVTYSERFGRPLSVTAEAIDPEGPIFDAMIGHISGLSREIAMMERLGPNPAATVRWVTDGMEMEAKQPKHEGGKRTAQNQKGKRIVQGLYDELSGRNMETADTTLASVGQAARSFQVAAKLGSAVLSAVSDVGFQHVTAKFNGLSSANIVANYGMLLVGAPNVMAVAKRLRMINENSARMAASASRFTGEVITGELMGRMAEGVMSASGLNAWTQAGRWSFGMEFWSHLTDEVGRSWGNINNATRKQLERYGFNEANWEAIRSTPLEDTGDGGTWLLPENIADQGLAERLSMMIATETDYAVPTASLRISAAVNSTLKRGTWIGEIGRSALLFKSFPMTVMWMHGRRMAESGGVDRLKYAARLAITTTMMGAVAIQLKNLAAGKDIQEVDPREDPKFWVKAFAQGGGAGVLGDFVGQSTNRFDQKLAEWAAGPVFSSAQAAKNLGEAAIGQIGADEPYAAKTKTAKALRNFIQGNTPGSSLWYVKLAFQREVLDQLQVEMDPDYYDSFSKMEQRAQEDGTDFWWTPGETAPERAPKLTGN